MKTIEASHTLLRDDAIHYVDINDTRIAYRSNADDARIQGSATSRSIAPVLMLHSLFFDASMFDAVRSAMPASIAVFVPDHRGQGRSASGKSKPSMAQLARDMIVFIETRVGEPVNVIGSSMGGYVALEIARLRPDLIHTYTLSCCTARTEQQPERFAALEARIREEGTSGLGTVLCETMFGSRFVAEGSATLTAWREAFMSRGADVADAVHGVFARNSFVPVLPTITQPMLVCSGALDRAKRPEDMQFIADQVSGTRHVVFDDAGHTPPVESPIRFAREVLAFLDVHGTRA